jgi:hypothetical protein
MCYLQDLYNLDKEMDTAVRRVESKLDIAAVKSNDSNKKNLLDGIANEFANAHSEWFGSRSNICFQAEETELSLDNAFTICLIDQTTKRIDYVKELEGYFDRNQFESLKDIK